MSLLRPENVLGHESAVASPGCKACQVLDLRPGRTKVAYNRSRIPRHSCIDLSFDWSSLHVL